MSNCPTSGKVASDLHVTNLAVSKNIVACDGKFNSFSANNGSISGNFNVNGNLTVGRDSNLNDVNASGNLYVNGSGVIQNDLIVGGDLIVNGNEIVQGNLTVEGILDAMNISGGSLGGLPPGFYREGTFVPFVGGSTMLGTAGYVYHVGQYTQIGRIILFTAHLVWNGIIGAAGDMVIANLPYTTPTDAQNRFNANISVSTLNNFILGGGNVAVMEPNSVQGFIEPGESQIRVSLKNTDGHEPVGIPRQGDIVVSGHYIADGISFREGDFDPNQNSTPETFIQTGPSGTESVTTATFTFIGVPLIEIARYEYRLDPAGPGDPWIDNGTSTMVSFSGLSVGPHLFEVRAVGINGEVDPTPAARQWLIDGSAPDTFIISPPNNTYIQGTSFTATFNGVDDVAIDHFEFKILPLSSPAPDPGNPFEWDALPINQTTVTIGDGGLGGPPLVGSPTPITYRLYALAVDVSGRRDLSPATIDVIVDTVNPDTCIVSGPAEGSIADDVIHEFVVEFKPAPGSTISSFARFDMKLDDEFGVVWIPIPTGSGTFTTTAGSRTVTIEHQAAGGGFQTIIIRPVINVSSPLENGDHIIQFRSVSLTGTDTSISGTEAERRWTVRSMAAYENLRFWQDFSLTTYTPGGAVSERGIVFDNTDPLNPTVVSFSDRSEVDSAAIHTLTPASTEGTLYLQSGTTPVGVDCTSNAGYRTGAFISSGTGGYRGSVQPTTNTAWQVRPYYGQQGFTMMVVTLENSSAASNLPLLTIDGQRRQTQGATTNNNLGNVMAWYPELRDYSVNGSSVRLLPLGRTFDNLRLPHGITKHGEWNVFIARYNNCQLEGWINGVRVGATRMSDFIRTGFGSEFGFLLNVGHIGFNSQRIVHSMAMFNNILTPTEIDEMFEIANEKLSSTGLVFPFYKQQIAPNVWEPLIEDSLAQTVAPEPLQTHLTGFANPPAPPTINHTQMNNYDTRNPNPTSSGGGGGNALICQTANGCLNTVASGTATIPNAMGVLHIRDSGGQPAPGIPRRIVVVAPSFAQVNTSSNTYDGLVVSRVDPLTTPAPPNYGFFMIRARNAPTGTGVANGARVELYRVIEDLVGDTSVDPILAFDGPQNATSPASSENVINRTDLIGNPLVALHDTDDDTLIATYSCHQDTTSTVSDSQWANYDNSFEATIGPVPLFQGGNGYGIISAGLNTRYSGLRVYIYG